MTSARVLAPAKLTWSLEVGERRADGYHDLVAEMLTSRDMLVRRLREGVEFFQFLRHREDMIVS